MAIKRCKRATIPVLTRTYSHLVAQVSKPACRGHSRTHSNVFALLFSWGVFPLALWLYCLATWLAAASPAPATGKPLLPEDLRFDFQAVPAEQNAFLLWRRAAELYVAPNEKVKESLKYCYSPEARKPTADEMAALQNWLKRNHEALELFRASLAKPKAQWPERDAEKPQPEMAVFSYLTQASLLTADQMAEHSQFDAATSLLEGCLHLSQMSVEGDSTLIHYLVACRVRTFIQDAILRLAARKAAPLPILEQLLKDLPTLDSETNTYAAVLRVEFAYQYNHHLDVNQEAVKWTKLLETNSLSSIFFPEDCQRPARVLLNPTLVEMHPLPFDQKADLEEVIRHYRIYRTNACSSWADRSGAVETDYDLNHSNLLQEISPLMKLVEKEPLPLSRLAAQRARAAYLELKNPMGRILDCSSFGIAGIGSDNKVFKNRTERAATRAVLALLIFEHRKGILPANLSDLVAEKILPAVPTDPFSGEPLLYSPQRRLVWSVSLDATDDGGKAGKSRWTGDDAVWTIPTLN